MIFNMDFKENLQHYEFEEYTVVTNFPTYEDALKYASEKNGELIEVGFTDGADNPAMNSSANLMDSKKVFKVELPGKDNYQILYSDSDGFQEWAQEVLTAQKKLENDMAPEDWMSDQNVAPGDRIIILEDGKLNTVTTRERIKFLMRGNLYELAVKVANEA